MTIQDVFIIAAEIGDFPTVQIEQPLKHHPNTIGKITQIKPSGVSVDLGAKWDAWFNAEQGNDKRSKYMSELKSVPI